MLRGGAPGPGGGTPQGTLVLFQRLFQADTLLFQLFYLSFHVTVVLCHCVVFLEGGMFRGILLEFYGRNVLFSVQTLPNS